MSAVNLTEVLTSTATAIPLDVLAKHFHWFDHVIFVAMLGVSAVIGIWFGFCGKKEDSAEEYLLGGRSMGVVPTALSLTASCISGTTILGVPSDVYVYGTSYWMGNINVFTVCMIVSYVYLPVFFKLQLTSTYEYLKLRFGPKLRSVISIISILSAILHAPIYIYIPALAFSQVTGINLHLITPIVCATCIFYTTVGGLKGVVWTDTVQLFGIIIGAIAVLFLGVNLSGGFANIWHIADEGKRLEFFNMTPDITQRTTVWATTIGLLGLFLSNMAVSQLFVQRFLSVPTLSDARKTMALSMVGVLMISTISCFSGLIIYAKYAGCDPLKTGQVKRPDQLLPYYVMDVAGHLPGLPGLFVAGVFSAALSSMSTSLNCLSAIIYKDFIASRLPKNTSERTINIIMKAIVVISGIIGTLLVFVVEKLGGILQLAITLGGVSAGPTLGLFTMGMLFPKANYKGAMAGGITAFATLLFMTMGSQYHIATGGIRYDKKPFSVEHCYFPVNITTPITNATFVGDEPSILFRISFYYYSTIGLILVLLIGVPVSYWTYSKEDRVHPNLLSPVVHWLLSEDQKNLPPEYKSVEDALEIVKLNDGSECEKSERNIKSNT